MAKTNTLIQTSEAFKEAIGQFAQQRKKSVNEIVRIAVAQYIGYDISSEVVVDGRRKYANEDERIQAQRDKAKAKRQLATKLVSAALHDEQIAKILGIEQSLLRKGINPYD